MKWVTRRSIRVNRMATAWLIRRFIDPEAVFLFVEPDEVATIQQREGAQGFDALGAPYPHKDEKGRCSFEALVEQYCGEDHVLRAMARIVRGADFPEEITLTPESAGLRAISHGFPFVAETKSSPKPAGMGQATAFPFAFTTTSPSKMSWSRSGLSQSQEHETRRWGSCGVTKTRTITISCEPMRWKTMSCSTKSRTESVRT